MGFVAQDSTCAHVVWFQLAMSIPVGWTEKPQCVRRRCEVVSHPP